MKRIVLQIAVVVFLSTTTALAQQPENGARTPAKKVDAIPAELLWPPHSDAALRKQFMIPDGKTLLFRDAHGATLSEADFLAALPSAGGFSFNGNDAIVVQLTLNVPGGPPPKPRSFQVNRGDPMPALAGTTIDGKPFGSANFMGRMTLVNFVYAGCTYCIQEVPALNQFAADNPSIQTVAITYDDPVLMREFVKKWHFRWPVVAGEVDYVNKLGLWEYPSLALIDAKGELVGFDASGNIHKKNQVLTSADITAWVARISSDGKRAALPKRNASPSN